MLSSIITLSLIGLLLLWFILSAYTDLTMLLRRPNRGLGTGLNRIWSVAHTTLLEAWAGRVWLLPPLWFAASLILLLTVRPFDESERIPLYIRMLMLTQEILLLVMVGIMACLSLPRERERKIIITNASKPLSRLEILLGKMLGFSITALGLLLVMAAATWGILFTTDQWMRSTARAEYAFAQADYHNKIQKNEAPGPDPVEKKELAENGSLFAYNYITVPKGGLSIVGRVDRTGGVKRYLKGGSSEKISYLFPPIEVPPNPDVLPTGHRPFFMLFFPALSIDSDVPLPDQVPLEVTASLVKPPSNSGPAAFQQKTIHLNLDPKKPRPNVAIFELDTPSQIFTTPDQYNGEILVTVSCSAPTVFLQILEGEDKSNPWAANAYAFPFQNTGDPAKDGNHFSAAPRPVVAGFERYDKQQVGGPTPQENFYFHSKNQEPPVEIALFRFPAAALAKVPVDHGNFKLHMVLDIDKDKNQTMDTTARIVAYNESDLDPNHATTLTTNVLEKRNTELTLPQSLLGNADPAKRSDLVIMITCATEGHWLAMNESSVRIEEPPSPFLLNLLKSEAVLFFEAALLVVICVAASVRLGWPVAMFVAACAFFLGFLRPFITGILEAGGLGALGYTNFNNDAGTAYKIINGILSGFYNFIAFIIYLLPDFTRFDSVSQITQLRNMPWSTLAADGGWFLLYSLPFIALGYLFFRKQELG